MEISLYFHIPFCRRRCGYCDFNTFAGLENLIPEYIKSLNQEVEKVLLSSPEPLNVHTIYFGGGTPSLLDASVYEKIFTTIRKYVSLVENAEISLEANPEALSQQSIEGYRQAGFNRISIGMQSASQFDLKLLDRTHSNQSLLKSVEWCKKAGFKHINLDLIFGIPGQTLDSWLRTLKLAMGMGVDHLSLYSLIIEEGTRLKQAYDLGLIVERDEDLEADMYEAAMEILHSDGYRQYEISNWARDDSAFCRHNLQYWRYLPYLGFGAGAHGFWGHTRTENLHTVADYISAVNQKEATNFPAGPASFDTVTLNLWEMMQEHMMVSLRLTEEGVSLKDYDARYGVEPGEVFSAQIEKLTREGLIELNQSGSRLRLTRSGKLFGNRVFSAFIANKVPAGYEYLLGQ